MSNQIESRKSEVRFVTSDPDRMLGKFIARRVFKTWKEDHIDKSTNEVVTIERSEVVLEKGTYVSPEVQSSIRFLIAAGEIKEVEVSNQKRLAMVEANHSLYPYKAVVRINGGRKTFLFYAVSIGNALKILTDYVELNFKGGFTVSDIKGLDYCMVIIDNLKSPSKRRYEIDTAYLKNEITMEEYVNATCDGIEGGNRDAVDEEDDDSPKEVKKFYQIGAHIVLHHDKEGDEEEDATFIVQTFSAVRANMLIEKYLRDKQEDHYRESLLHPERTFVKRQINSFIEESKVIPIGYFIPVDFSKVYSDDDD